MFEYELFWKHKIAIKEEMIKDFIILNCIGKNDKIGLKVNNNFFIHHFNQKIKNNDQLVRNILNLIKKHKVNISK